MWDYRYASASRLFGRSTGDPIADRIRQAVKTSNAGLSKYQIRRLFDGHLEGDRIDAALKQLVTLGALSPQSESTGGRPSTLWSAPKQDGRSSDESVAEEQNLQEEEEEGF